MEVALFVGHRPLDVGRCWKTPVLLKLAKGLLSFHGSLRVGLGIPLRRSEAAYLYGLSFEPLQPLPTDFYGAFGWRPNLMSLIMCCFCTCKAVVFSSNYSTVVETM